MNSPQLFLLFAGLLATDNALAQIASAPEEPVLPGITADERIDVTGDGIADLLITTRVDRTPDPEQGLEGWYRREVRTLPGTSILMGPTDYKGGYYTLTEGAHIDTAALAKGFHFKQLMWSAANEPIAFNLLERAFGPGLAKEADGWYGTGMYYDGTMILRSTVGGTTRIAPFNLWFLLPSGRIGVTANEAISVPADFGKEGDPPPPLPKTDDPYSFGHEEEEPQLVIPPGLPPDVRMDLVGDEAQDVVLTGHEERMDSSGRKGYYIRGVSPLPGVAFLMRREKWGSWGFFRLGEEDVLTPEQLSSGLEANILKWASPEREAVFVPALRHPFGQPEEPQEWSLVDDTVTGDLVYRTSYYGHTTIIGVLEVRAYAPGGELRVQPQNWVEEGKPLQVR